MHTEEQPVSKKKIAVLGAGPSGMSALLELTRYPGWDQLYDVTVYQFGWQLGGKCRTGRGLNDRIEEHGIHIFLGFYNNAMRTVRQTFEEWTGRGLKPPGCPFETWTDLFDQQWSILLPEYRNGKWIPWALEFPKTDGLPGIGDVPTHQQTVKKMLELMLEMLLGSPYGHASHGLFGRLGQWIVQKIWPKEPVDRLNTTPQPQRFSQPPGERPADWEKHKSAAEKQFVHIQGPHKYLHYAKTLVGEMPANEDHAREVHAQTGLAGHPSDHILHLMHAFMEGFELLFHHRMEHDDQLRRFWLLAQLGYYNLVGLNRIYNPQTGQYDFDQINHLDYREWLLLVGAPEEVVWSAPVKDIYTLVFAYPKGDTSQAGAIAAGTALQGAMLIMLGYKGSVMYRFHGGTADVIISPMYQVLKQRGVKFKFFHQVEEIRYAEGNAIEEMVVAEQIKLRDGVDEFQPLRLINGLYCWPAHPFWRWQELADQIDPESLDALKKGNINLNSHWSGWKNYKTHVLKKGVDFDHIILSISIDGLKEICKDLIANKQRWKDMVENVQTVQTQGVQIWMTKTAQELGFDLEALGMQKTDQPVLDTYANSNNSYADYTELLRWENWEGRAKSIAYFCGPLSEPDPIPDATQTDFPKLQELRVREQFTQWLSDNAAWIWPNGATPENPTGLNLDLLADPLNRPNVSGLEKLNAQYFTANIDPSERYVLSLPGSGKYRLKTDASEYDNLFLAGDWIDTGYNMGCAEVAFMSGLMAAQALRKNAFGLTDHQPILKDL